jgi:signal transduction histidine kinase
MQGFSDTLIEEVGATLSQTGRDFAHRISASAQFLDSLLRDLIAFNGIAEKRIELTPTALDSIIQHAVSSLETEIRAKNARVEAVGEWPIAMGHETTLRTVLAQLVSNALKFVAPKVRPRVRMRSEGRGEFIRVWVEEQRHWHHTLSSGANL